MTDEILLYNRIESLCSQAAKELYNLAVCTVRDKSLAERITVDTFAAAIRCVDDTSDMGRFKSECCRLLYQGIRKTAKETNSYLYIPAETNRLNALLCRLKYDERFMLLLFCSQKFSVRQISQIMKLPSFIVKRRLNAMLYRVN